MNNTQDLTQLIETLADDKIRAFSAKIIPTKCKILGLTSPQMKDVIKRAIKGEFGEPLSQLDQLPDDCYETLAVQGGIIAGVKVDTETRKKIIDGFVPKIDNWATCDSFIASCKFIGKDLDAWFDYLKAYTNSNTEFSIRVGVIALMSYYLTDEYIDKVLEIIKGIDYDAYYVKMAVAWCVATALAKFYDKTVKTLENGDFDKWTHNKAIQKAIESYRISDEQKTYLRSLKIK